MRTSASILSLHSGIATLPGSILLFYETACTAPRRLNLLACYRELATTAKPHRDLVRAVLSACIADPIDVRALATRPDVIGVETGDVRHSGNQHVVTINVDAVRGSSIPGEIHPLLPLHLVAACTERDLARCRSRRSCWSGSSCWGGSSCCCGSSCRCRRRCRCWCRCRVCHERRLDRH